MLCTQDSHCPPPRKGLTIHSTSFGNGRLEILHHVPDHFLFDSKEQDQRNDDLSRRGGGGGRGATRSGGRRGAATRSAGRLALDRRQRQHDQ